MRQLDIKEIEDLFDWLTSNPMYAEFRREGVKLVAKLLFKEEI